MLVVLLVEEVVLVLQEVVLVVLIVLVVEALASLNIISFSTVSSTRISLLSISFLTSAFIYILSCQKKFPCACATKGKNHSNFSHTNFKFSEMT